MKFQNTFHLLFFKVNLDYSDKYKKKRCPLLYWISQGSQVLKMSITVGY